MVSGRFGLESAFDLAGLLAKHFGGALPFERLESMSRQEMLFYYRIYEKQAEEENVSREFSRKNKAIPDPYEMRKIVDRRIAARRDEERKKREGR